MPIVYNSIAEHHFRCFHLLKYTISVFGVTTLHFFQLVWCSWAGYSRVASAMCQQNLKDSVFSQGLVLQALGMFPSQVNRGRAFCSMVLQAPGCGCRGEIVWHLQFDTSLHISMLLWVLRCGDGSWSEPHIQMGWTINPMLKLHKSGDLAKNGSRHWQDHVSQGSGLVHWDTWNWLKHGRIAVDWSSIH